VRPDVLANGDTEALPRELDHGRRGGGLEVAVLVEHIVGGQEAFPGDHGDAAAVAEGGRVVERPAAAGGVELDRADERGHLNDGGGDVAERFGGVGHKAPLEEQIARRVTADDQFGEDHDLGALRDQPGVGLQNAAAVAGKIADNGVKLG